MRPRPIHSLAAPPAVRRPGSRAAWLWRWGPPLLWMAVIFALSSRSQLPSAPQPLLDLLLKKAAHVAEYGVLALLWLRALSPAGWRSARGPALAAFVIATLYAVSDELHQALVPGRHPQPVDVLIDAAGAAAALLAIRLPWQVHAGRDQRSDVPLRRVRELWREIRPRPRARRLPKKLKLKITN